MSRMHNLTLASAKHLLSQGHITPAHHQRIVASAMATPPTSPTPPTMPTKPKMPKQAKPPGGFGSLAKGVAPVQAQAPIPGVSGPSMTPPGMASGYEDQ